MSWRFKHPSCLVFVCHWQQLIHQHTSAVVVLLTQYVTDLNSLCVAVSFKGIKNLCTAQVGDMFD